MAEICHWVIFYEIDVGIKGVTMIVVSPSRESVGRLGRSGSKLFVLTETEMVLALTDNHEVWRGHLPHECIIPICNCCRSVFFFNG